MTEARDVLVQELASLISARHRGEPLLIAIDGVDGAGKTTLANELIAPLDQRAHKVVRASIDGFHNPREVRIAKGPLSPEGYYYDSFDYDFLREKLLRPIRSTSLPIKVPLAKFDWKSNSTVEEKLVEIGADTIFLFEGVFLFRPELNEFWDYRVFVRIRPETSLERGLNRDSSLLGGIEATKEKYLKRYIPGQAIYTTMVKPEQLASIVIENDDFTRPVLRVQDRK